MTNEPISLMDYVMRYGGQKTKALLRIMEEQERHMRSVYLTATPN